MAASGVSSFGVVAGQPAEDLAAATRRVGPAGPVLQNFAFEGGVERFRQCVVGTCPHCAHGLGDPRSAQSFAKSFEVY